MTWTQDISAATTNFVLITESIPWAEKGKKERVHFGVTLGCMILRKIILKLPNKQNNKTCLIVNFNLNCWGCFSVLSFQCLKDWNSKDLCTLRTLRNSSLEKSSLHMTSIRTGEGAKFWKKCRYWHMSSEVCHFDMVTWTSWHTCWDPNIILYFQVPSQEQPAASPRKKSSEYFLQRQAYCWTGIYIYIDNIYAYIYAYIYISMCIYIYIIYIYNPRVFRWRFWESILQRLCFNLFFFQSQRTGSSLMVAQCIFDGRWMLFQASSEWLIG